MLTFSTILFPGLLAYRTPPRSSLTVELQVGLQIEALGEEEQVLEDVPYDTLMAEEEHRFNPVSHKSHFQTAM